MTRPEDFTLCTDFLKKRREAAGLSGETLVSIAERALEIGEKTAVDYKGKDLDKLAKEFKISLRMETGGVVGNRLLRAQYDDSVKCITVYQDGLEQLLQSGRLEELGLPASRDQVRDMLLWHEFFHVLEFHKIGMVGKQFPLAHKVLCFSVKKPFYAASELSAHAFVRDVLGLKRLPLYLDYAGEGSAQTLPNQQ